MSFWSENYTFIKDVYDTRVCKMTEWMDHIEMAISKVNRNPIQLVTFFLEMAGSESGFSLEIFAQYIPP